MSCRSITWFVSILVAAVIATDYGYAAPSDDDALVLLLIAADSGPRTTIRPPGILSLGKQTPATAVPSTTPRTASEREEAAIAVIRDVIAEEKSRLLIKAAKDRAVSKMQALLEAGADVESKDAKNLTALHWAAIVGSQEAASFLIASRANVEARDNLQYTPLHQAAAKGKTAVVKVLLGSFANPNAKDVDGRTPLHHAALQGYAEVASALVEGGASREARDNAGKTPLDLAIEKNRNNV